MGIQEKNPNQMLVKILVFCVEKCSKNGGGGESFFPNLLQKNDLSVFGKYHCASLLIPNLGKRPISNVLNQSLVISLSMCS